MLIPQFNTSITFDKITGFWKVTLTLTDVFCPCCESYYCAHATCTFTAVADTGEAAVESVYQLCADTLRGRFLSEVCVQSLQDLQVHDGKLD